MNSNHRKMRRAAFVAALSFVLAACDQISSAIGPASDLVGTWGPPTNPSLALPHTELRSKPDRPV